jgi:hypothetical protein
MFLEQLSSGEAVIGVYTGGPQESQVIVVSDEALIFHDDGWRRVPFSEMRAVRINTEGIAKIEAEQLHIQTADGARRIVTVAGGDSRSRDVFEFARFVKRAARP